MDQRRSDVGQDVRAILETRTAISQKLEMLEHRIQETVEGTKTTVEELVDRVKDAADDFVDRTKQTFDPTHQIHQHPWAMVGGAIVAGYVLGLLEARVASEAGRRTMSSYDAPARAGETGMVMTAASPLAQSNLWQDISREVSGEIEHAKHALLEVGRSFVHEFFQQAIPALGASILGRRDTRSAGSAGQHRENGSEVSRGVYSG